MVNGFVSFESEIATLVEGIVANPSLHGLWLNTLSFLENCGARKIAACEHPTLVKEEMLKHAAEEFRHAFYLKSQLARIEQDFEDYRLEHLLGAFQAYHYLDALDLRVCRHFRSQGATPSEERQLAYLLVTYAIELRASELYPIYQAALKAMGSKVRVQSILLEEKEHLAEMERELKEIAMSLGHVEVVCKIEAELFGAWLQACRTSLVNREEGLLLSGGLL